MSGLVRAEREREVGEMAHGCIESTAYEHIESFIYEHQVTPLEEDHATGVQLTVVCVEWGRVRWLRTQ